MGEEKIIKFPHRIGAMLRGLAKGNCAEVGVFQGKYSKAILRDGKPEKLFLIDPWEEQDQEIYSDVSNVANSLQEKNYRQVCKLDPKRVEVIRMLSAEAAGKFSDSSLDFVYLDGNHKKENVIEDLNLWWPKIKSGGWLCGHDYKIKTKIFKGVKTFLEVGEALEEWLPTIGRASVSMETVKGDSYGILK